MATLDKVWDNSLPVFLLNAEFKLKKQINLPDIVFRSCLDLKIPKDLVTISYDNCFVLFKQPDVNIETIFNYLKLLQQNWNYLSHQCDYEHFYELEIYGNFTSKLPNHQYREVVGLGRRIELCDNLEVLNSMSLQKAIQASYVALPF